MIVLGLILLVAAAVFGVDIVIENTADTSGTIFQQTVTGLSLGGVFLAGAVTALVFAIGLWLALGGARRSARRRRAYKSELRSREAEKESLAADRERLARELEAERRSNVDGRRTPYPEDGSTRVDAPATETTNGRRA